MRILYAASGEIALPLLKALDDRGLVVAVLTSPDKRGKRGSELIPSPIKREALLRSLPVFEFESLKREAREAIIPLKADTLLSFCYGKIFGPKFLSLFERKLNVHPSLLPKYRGVSPIYTVIKEGDSLTGISLQNIDLKVDEGDIYSQMELPLNGEETTESLTERVSALSPDFVLDALKEIESIIPFSQIGEATYTQIVEKEDGDVDFNLSAKTIHQRIRALYPWPRAYAYLGDEKLILSSVYGSSFDEFEKTSGEEPGKIIALDKEKGLKVATGDGYIYITRLQAPFKKEMDAKSFYNGNRGIIGGVLKRGKEL